jgi:peptide deformylase
MSDDVLVFNTETEQVQQQRIDPLPLYGEDFYMLKQVMPEYTDALPNPIMSKLVSRLKMTMRKFGGIGLSANQCGVAARVFVIGADDFHMVCINPKVVATSEGTVREDEGCLSYPGMYLKVARPMWIDVEYLDDNGQLHQQRLTGVTARCFLHELDHMNGVRFVEHVGPVAIRMAKKKVNKMIKQVKKAKRDGLLVQPR